MDSNTRDVLMALITAIITPLIILYVSKRQGIKIEAKVEEKIGGLDSKVDEYHKAVNGNMEKLLNTTADLATAQEKARNEAAK